MVKPVSGVVEAPKSVVVEDNKDVVVTETEGKRASGEFQSVAPEDADLSTREASAAEKRAAKFVAHIEKGAQKAQIAADYLDKNEVGKAGKKAKESMGELKEVISDINKAEGKAKLGFVKKLAVALLKVATSLSKLCEFLAGLTIEVMGEDDKSAVTQIAKLIRSITKPINEFVKNYEAKAKEKAEAALKEVEDIAEAVEEKVDELVEEAA